MHSIYTITIVECVTLSRDILSQYDTQVSIWNDFKAHQRLDMYQGKIAAPLLG
jgi:hypothetical protein